MAESRELSPSECEALLRSGVAGRVALVTPGGPHIVPVNYSIVDDAVIIRTEKLVNDGDLEGALMEMRRLPATARTAFAPWIARAEPRIELDRRLAAVRAASIAHLSGGRA